eukprot:s2526_g6.t2
MSPRQSFLITRNAVVAACSRSSEWLSAVQLLQDFQRDRLQDLREQRISGDGNAQVMPYEFAVSACAKGEQWQLGLELTNSMLERRFEVHPITRSVAIGMCGWAEGRSVAPERSPRLAEVLSPAPPKILNPKQIQYVPGVVRFFSLPPPELLLLVHQGQQCGDDISELVLRLLDDSDNVMLNGKALNVLAKSSWQRGVQLLQSMVSRKVADKISYISMMNAFETTGNWRQALQLLQDVRQEGVEACWRARSCPCWQGAQSKPCEEMEN